MKHTNKIRILVGVLLLTAMIAVPFFTPLKQYLSIPNKLVTFINQAPFEVPALGDKIKIKTDNKNVQAINSSKFQASKTGNSQLVYNVAGFPVKKVDLSVLDDVKVVPGGESIGVQLHTLGVLVVGHHLVKGDNGASSPGEKANIKVGDIILKINGKSVKEMADVKPYVEEAGESGEDLDVTIKRGKETMKTTLHPEKDKKSSEYQIGLYIRDSAAGIGTMTFYEPKSKKYGALGHVISDMDTQKPIQVHNGTIVGSQVTSIEKGDNGAPGEKQAKFSVKDDKLGNITKNSPYGIFGKLKKSVENGIYDKPMPIALSHQVKEGPAKILTVVDGEKVEAFDVEIVSSVPQKYPATKGMIIKITDPKLLKKTGGIVQGMSGSPIIQDGKVLGAVTHVFVNDPTSGYGVHIEWMLQEAGINVNDSQKKAS